MSAQVTNLERASATYTTVRTVCPSPLLRCLVDLDVLDNEIRGIETLGVGIRLGVLEKIEEVSGGLFGPAGFADAKLLACCRCMLANHCLNEIMHHPLRSQCLEPGSLQTVRTQYHM